jgi:hypothetical protein
MRRLVVTSIVCLVAAVGLWALVSWHREPSYNGKSLSDWVNATTKTPVSGPTADRWEEAIKHMGTNAAPLLVKWLASEPMFGWRRFFKAQNALPASLRASRITLWLRGKADSNESRNELRAAAAERALIVLGKDAKPAIPGLLLMLGNSGTPSRAFRAGNVLAGLGKESFPALLQCFSDPQFTNYFALVQVLAPMRGFLQGEGAAAVPNLCSLLQRADPALKQACAEALGNVAAAPEMAVPCLARAMTNAIQNADIIVSGRCAEALGRFGSRGSAAVAALCFALSAPDGVTSEESARTLGKIGGNSDMAVPALIAYLRSAGTTGHRKYAIEGLRGYGEAAREAIQLIREALNDDDHDTRDLAQQTLQRLAGN